MAIGIKFPIDSDKLIFICDMFKIGGPVIYPADNLYALGASIYSKKALKRVWKYKKRPKNMPISIMATDEQIKELCIVPEIASPFFTSHDTQVTAIFRATNKAPPVLVHNGTLSVRLPTCQVMENIIKEVGPVTATSANRHGFPTLPTVEEIIKRHLPKVEFFIDNGFLQGIPTTLIDYTGQKPKVIREGALSPNDMRKIYG